MIKVLPKTHILYTHLAHRHVFSVFSYGDGPTAIPVAIDLYGSPQAYTLNPLIRGEKIYIFILLF